jgi:hypothetical protein
MPMHMLPCSTLAHLLTPPLISFFAESMIKKSISNLEYTHKNENIDMCFDEKYLIVLYKMFI